MSHILTRQTLASFDGALAAAAPLVRACLEPGPSEDRVRGELEAIGLQPSKELLRWWTYFDGPAEACRVRPLEILPGLEFLSRRLAVRAYRSLGEVAVRSAAVVPSGPVRPDDIWHPQWIPIFGILSGGEVVVDCSNGSEQAAPLRIAYPDEIDERVLAPDLGTFIAQSTTWLNAGEHGYDAEAGRWPLESWKTALPDRFVSNG